MCLDCCIAPGVVSCPVPEVAGNQGFRDGFRDTQARDSVLANSGVFWDTPLGLDKPIEQRLGMAWRVGIKG